jgi:bacillithiol system protein YtxJ
MKINWQELHSSADVDAVVERSMVVPCLIFKHSTRCEISSIAKYRFESDWGFEEKDMEAYYLDLLQFRSVSTYISELFAVYHESPQALLIDKGVCVFDVSHLDIRVDELTQALSSEYKS